MFLCIYVVTLKSELNRHTFIQGQRNFNQIQPPPQDQNYASSNAPDIKTGAAREAELQALWNDTKPDDGSEEWGKRRAQRAASQFCFPTLDGSAAMMFWANCPWFPRICAAFDPAGGEWLADRKRLNRRDIVLSEFLPALKAVWATKTNEVLVCLWT